MQMCYFNGSYTFMNIWKKTQIPKRFINENVLNYTHYIPASIVKKNPIIHTKRERIIEKAETN